jgi:hypothetical protein
MQDRYVVCYKLRKLKHHENNYFMHELGLATIVHSLKVMEALVAWKDV